MTKTQNAPRKALTAAVNKAVANGAPVVTAVVAETKMSKLLAQWHRQYLRMNPDSVDYPNREEIFAQVAGFNSKQMLRLAAFFQSVASIYNAENEMTQEEKDAKAEMELAVRQKAREESDERNMGNRAKAERLARETNAKPFVGMAVFAPDLDSNKEYVLFPAHVTELPNEEAETFMVKWVDGETVEVPFVVASSERAHRAETHRVPTDAQCDLLDAWYDAIEGVAAPVEAPAAKVKKVAPAKLPVASDDDMLSDADLLTDDAAPAAKPAKVAKAAASKPSAAKVAAPAAKVAPAKKGGPAKRTA